MIAPTRGARDDAATIGVAAFGASAASAPLIVPRTLFFVRVVVGSRSGSEMSRSYRK
jgi:hypothetical protein